MSVMETSLLISVPFTGGLKRFWRRRAAGYERLDGGKKNIKVIRLGGKRKRTWKIRAAPKLRWRLKFVSPLKLLAKLRDAYINVMLGWAGNVGSLNGGDGMFGGKRIPRARKVVVNSNDGDFQTKLILEIYKSLKASRGHELAVL